MKKRRIITSLCFAILLTVSSASLALAQSTISQSNVLNAYGKKFTISHKADGKLTQKELQAIAEQATSEEIRIENVYHAPTENRETFTPSAWYDVSVDWNVVKNVTQRDTPLQARQITSVAAGSTKKVTDTFKLSSNFKVSGSASAKGLSAAVESSLTSDITRTIDTVYEGPKIGSGYVSIIYWITPFVNRGTWKAEGTGWPSGDSYGPYDGSFEDANKFVEWSQPIK